MKFVCLNCETYMSFEKVEKPAEGSLGVFFACPSCEAKVSMVTNPGETQMVSSLGVQLGGRTVAPSPLEMTRGTLKEDAGAPAPSGSMADYLNEKIHAGQSASPAPGATAKEGESGGCPFSAMVAQMGLTERRGLHRHATGRAAMECRRAGTVGQAAVVRAADGQEQRGNVCAEERLFATVTLQVMDDSKNSSNGLNWSPEAEERLRNIPDFIQPMARKEIERLAQERGATTVSAELMDEAKEKFMKFM